METLQQYKMPIIVVVELALLLVVYFNRQKLMALFTPKGSTPSTKTNYMPSSSSSSAVLQRGSRGSEVEQLQQLLNDYHRTQTPTLIPLLAVDGVFGELTEKMLVKYTGKKAISLQQLKAALAALNS